MSFKESWVEIKDYPNYQVSDQGRIKNVITGRQLNPSLSKQNGYLRVNLCREDGCHTKTLHGLVVSTFMGETPDGLEINHLDGVKTNNTVDNFEFTTPSKNVRHAFELGLRLPTNKKVRCVETGEVFESYKNAAEKLGLNRSHVSQAVSGRVPTAKGYHFERVD